MIKDSSPFTCKMIVIVEGIDRVGKSTLCKKLSEETGIKIFKRKNLSSFGFDKMDNDNETDKEIQMLEIARIGNVNLIFDRLYFSDLVYGYSERSYDMYDALDNFEKVENQLKDMDAVLILVNPTDIESSSKQHGKDLNSYFLMFNFLFRISSMKKIKCDYNSIDETVEKVKEIYKNGRESRNTSV